MKAAIYNPYFDTLGGGERYVATVAKVLLEAGYKVDVEWKDSQLISKVKERFGIDLTEANIVKDINRGDGYDVCFWLSDGSIPTLRARKNILHFQMPFSNVKGKTLLNKMKLARINKVICNSKFTKHYIDLEFGTKSIVVYPPVDIENFKSKSKNNLILSVGRFSQLTQAKNQEVLIKEFIKLVKTGMTNYRLILAGGSEIGGKEYVEILKKMSKGYPVEILENPSFTKIKSLYGQAKIFWSASGYRVNEKINPKGVEHFGITVVEAMAAGVVPVIYSAGGHKEIIKNNETGFLWKTLQELKIVTKNVIQNRDLLSRVSKNATKESQKYGYERFKKELLRAI